MSNISETAIQQFNWWVNWELESLLDGTLGYEEFKQKMEASYHEFKAIEKEQIENAYNNGYNHSSWGRFSDPEKHYKETFEL